MKVHHLICGMITAALLAAPMSVGVGLAGSQEWRAGSSNTGGLPGAVRQATERFKDVEEAVAAGYQQFQGCVSGPEEGAMGVHYANFALFDSVLEVDRPEVLVYEPLRNGRLRLVAAEYITPAAAWHGSHAPGVQPDLMGHLLHFAPGPNRYGPDAFYEIHVWAWKTNSRGTFADWNPAVSCVEWEGQTATGTSHGAAH